MQKYTYLKFIFYLFIFCFFKADLFAFENSIGVKFKVIKPGKFLMGSPKSEPGHNKDEKLHTVVITKPFLISATEITQRQWLKIMDSNPSSSLNNCLDCPVDSVSWYEANEFIKKLNKKERARSYRLPTEAEWEYSCRAGSLTAFYTGDITAFNCDLDNALDKAAWYCGNSGLQKPYYNLKPHISGLKEPNKNGLYDMHGNVMEWCLDSTTWNNIFSRRAEASLETYKDGIINPLGKKGDKKILRGGSFVQSTIMARAAKRFFFRPGVKRNYIGFRLVKEIR